MVVDPEKKLKVAQIVSTFPPYAGGMGNVAWQYAKGLFDLGHDLTVFTLPVKVRNKKDYDFKIKEKRGWPQIGLAAFLPQLFWQLRKYDVVHLNYPFFGAELPIILAKTCGFLNKLILTYQMDVVGQKKLRWFFRLHDKFILPLVVKVADKIIVTSDDYARHSQVARFIGRYPKKFITIPLGVDIETFKPSDDKTILNSLDIKPDDKVLLFVAALDRAHYFKGLNYLLSAVKELPANYKLIIVGDGDLKDDYQKQVSGNKNIFFVGRASNIDLPRYYAAADMSILPSIDRSEAFGLVSLEAMACGTAVIVADLPGVRSVPIVGQTGLVVKLADVSDLKEKILQLGQNQTARLFGQAGRQHVLTYYTWPHIIKQIEKVYYDLL